jgi:glycosyltransferase involved in cell wall biosynthesis
MPRFSIVLISYNQRAYLPDALRSVREQTLDDWEIVAVDDGSTDGTLELLRAEAARDARLRVVALENGGAPGRSRNHGLDHVRGELVSFLDADDLYPRTRLAELHAAFERYPQAQLVFGDLVKFEDAPDERRPGTLAARGAETALLGLAAEPTTPPGGATLLDRRSVLEYAMTVVQPWATLNCVARREAIAGPGLRFDASLRNGEDFEFFTRIAAAGDVVYLPAVVGYYRIHATNITLGPGAPKRATTRIVHERKTWSFDAT